MSLLLFDLTQAGQDLGLPAIRPSVGEQISVQIQGDKNEVLPFLPLTNFLFLQNGVIDLIVHPQLFKECSDAQRSNLSFRSIAASTL